jgi:hypothetical protein
MRTWTTHSTVSAPADEVMALLTEPEAIRRWAPIDFEVDGLDGDRLAAGERARVTGRLAGRRVSFDVEVFEAADGHLSLAASGLISLDVEYRLRPAAAGSEVEASVSVRSGRGLTGRVLEHATGALLAAGALSTAVGRMDAALTA